MSKDLSLREKKNARMKLAILNAALELAGEKPFHELYVDDICERAEISKVTFFSYFPQKKDLLYYLMRIWFFHFIVESTQKSIKGKDGIYWFFNRAAREYDEHPGLLSAYFASQFEKDKIDEVSDIDYAEKLLLYPDKEDIDQVYVPSLQEIFINYLRKAKTENQLREDITLMDALEFLITIFYGSAITKRILKRKELRKIYQAQLKRIFKD